MHCNRKKLDVYFIVFFQKRAVHIGWWRRKTKVRTRYRRGGSRLVKFGRLTSLTGRVEKRRINFILCRLLTFD